MSSVNQYLSYTLAGEEFALDIARVREVLDLTKITRIPRMPQYLRGVINLRGQVVPVVDQRLKFGLETVDDGKDTRIIILDVEVGGAAVVLGAVADAVHEVIEIGPGKIAGPPSLGGSLNSNFIRGMGRREEDFVIILDVDRIFSAAELNSLAEVQSQAGDPPLQ